MSNYIRFLNADCMGNSNGFYIDGQKITELEFGKMSEYICVDNEKISVGLQPDGECDKCSLLHIDFVAAGVYTVAAVCVGGSGCLYAVAEMNCTDDISCTSMRVCNLSPSASGCDLYGGRHKIVGDIQYLDVSKYLHLVPDAYDFTVKKEDETILNTGRMFLNTGVYNTFYILEKTAGNHGKSYILCQDKIPNQK